MHAHKVIYCQQIQRAFAGAENELKNAKHDLAVLNV